MYHISQYYITTTTLSHITLSEWVPPGACQLAPSATRQQPTHRLAQTATVMPRAATGTSGSKPGYYWVYSVRLGHVGVWTTWRRLGRSESWNWRGLTRPRESAPTAHRARATAPHSLRPSRPSALVRFPSGPSALVLSLSVLAVVHAGSLRAGPCVGVQRGSCNSDAPHATVPFAHGGVCPCITRCFSF